MQLFGSGKPGIDGGVYFFFSQGFALVSHLYIVPMGNPVEVL